MCMYRVYGSLRTRLVKIITKILLCTYMYLYHVWFYTYNIHYIIANKLVQAYLLYTIGGAVLINTIVYMYICTSNSLSSHCCLTRIFKTYIREIYTYSCTYAWLHYICHKKSFAVYWISFKCRENICGSVLKVLKKAIALKNNQENFHVLLKIHEN